MSSKLFLFDMDGILFDSMPFHVRSWKQTADKYGLEAEEEEFYLFEGMRGRDTVAQLYHRTFGKEASKDIIEEIYHYKTTLYNSFLAPLKPIPYTRDVMSLLQEKGHSIAIVTGSTYLNAYPRIAELYSDFIREDYIVTAESVTQGKPHPQPYIMGMELFGKSPQDTVVVENAPLGVQSGHAAKAFTIAITTGPIKEYYLREAGANLLFPNMKALWIWCKENM